MKTEHFRMPAVATRLTESGCHTVCCGQLKNSFLTCVLHFKFAFVFLFSTFFFSGFRMLEEKEEPGFLTGLKIPAPWAAGKTVETVHPVRDNYKFKETVHIPGARCLYLRFDSRCSSQYDYDKVSRSQLSLPPLLSCFLFSFALAIISD